MVDFQSESESKEGRRPMPQLEDSQEERKNSFLLRLLFYSGFQQIRWKPTRTGESILFYSVY